MRQKLSDNNWQISLAFLTASGTLLAGCSASDNGNASAEGTGDSNPFAGETINFVVPYDPGGGYDVYARTLAPYMSDCLDAQVVIRNEPGAGGFLATNDTARAQPDENRIQIVNTGGVVAGQLAEDASVQFNAADLSWIGRLSSPPDVLVVGKDSDIQSFDDILTTSSEVRFVSTGLGSKDYINPTVLGTAYDFPYKIISGFASSGEASASLVSGNADAHIVPFDSALSGINGGDLRPIVMLSEEPYAELPKVPAILETAPPAEEDSEAILDDLVKTSATGRGVAGPPGMEEDRLSVLREGFQCAVDDQELREDFESQERPLEVLDGEGYEEQVRESLQVSEEFVALLKESF
jgi:tripartite-type tricarboxylate transporter receptor subunit TctC